METSRTFSFVVLRRRTMREGSWKVTWRRSDSERAVRLWRT